MAYTPSLIGTVLSYVEAGVGVGIVPESVMTPELPLKFVPLKPVVSVPLVRLPRARLLPTATPTRRVP